VDLTVGIVSYNTRDITCRCAEAVLKAVAHRPARVVVSDNGSTDGTLEALAQGYPEVARLPCPDNRGYAASLNRVLARYPARFLLAMNADVVLATDALARLQAQLVEHPECALVGPALVYPDGRPQPSAKRFPSLPFALGETLGLHWLFPRNRCVQRFYYGDRDLASNPWVDAVSGAAMLIRGEAYRQIGGFDEGFRMYFEETDLCRRLRAAGYRVALCPQASAIHWHGASTIQTSVRQVEYYLSYVRFFRKHHGAAAARLLAAAVALSTVARMVGLPIKYPPVSRQALDLLRPKLQACRQLLGDLMRPTIPRTPTEARP
jgi:GT2 family glycosyltransferase